MGQCFNVILIGTVMCHCAFTQSLLNLSEELRLRSKNDGLALVRSGMAPITFDQREHKCTSAETCARCSASGTAFFLPRSLDQPSASVLTCEYQAVHTMNGMIVDKGEVAPNGANVAFVGRYRTASPEESAGGRAWVDGLFVVQFTPNPVTTQIVPCLRKRHATDDDLCGDIKISWAPSSNSVAYSWRGSIWIFSAKSKRSTPIAKGKEPNWSPDGNWISFRSEEGHAMLFSLIDRSERALMPNRLILSGLRWSPDSKYMLFSEESRPALALYNRNLVVYRLKDGATAVVANLPDMTADAFSWTCCRERMTH